MSPSQVNSFVQVNVEMKKANEDGNAESAAATISPTEANAQDVNGNTNANTCKAKEVNNASASKEAQVFLTQNKVRLRYHLQRSPILLLLMICTCLVYVLRMIYNFI